MGFPFRLLFLYKKPYPQIFDSDIEARITDTFCKFRILENGFTACFDTYPKDSYFENRTQCQSLDAILPLKHHIKVKEEQHEAVECPVRTAGCQTTTDREGSHLAAGVITAWCEFRICHTKGEKK